jgi:phage gp16-like protein
VSVLPRIHAMRREVPGLREDEDWRDMLERLTGSRSARGLTAVQATAVVSELKRLGAKGTPSRPRQATSNGRSKAASKGLSGTYAPKLQALWIACWNLGLVEDASDAALNTFARRQTGLGHANWIRHHEHARAVIEALKAMTKRAGVYWGPLAALEQPWKDKPGARIAVAQWRSLKAAQPDLNAKPFYTWVREETGELVQNLDDAGWIVVMNKLGRMIRAEGGS